VDYDNVIQFNVIPAVRESI